jgi:hypothetical protein
MSTQILIKRSTTTGAIPTTSDIAVGELAVNTTDKRIFTNNSGTIVELGTTPTTQAVTGNASVGGTFDVVGAVTVGNLTADGTVDLTSATVTIPAPTADTHPATKKYVDDEVNAILDGAPAALDTLNEIAAAINDDANLYTTLTTSIATKLSLAGGTMTGSIDMGANSVTTSADPATDNTLTRKSYVDGLYQSTVDAEVSAANALASEQAAATSASNASTSASASATSATASASSATNAASSATAAASSATSSVNSATASATSATQSAASATQAQALVDSIESFYLGAEASAPTVDDNGDPLQAGDWYFNTTDDNTYIYNGSAWQSVSPDLVADLTPQLGGNLDTNGNDVTFGDNDKAIFGAGSDLQIYHDTLNSVIADSGTGNLVIAADDFRLTNSTQTANMIKADEGGAVTLTHNGGNKLATTSTGIDVTGTATMDGLTVDGANVVLQGATTSLDINPTTGQPNITIRSGNTFRGYIEGNASGGMTFGAGPSALTRQTIASNGDISFYEDTGTTAKFFWDASAESLGIGTSSPISTHGTQLTVYGASNGGLSLATTTNASAISQNGNDVYFDISRDGSAGNLIFRRSSSFNESMRLDSSGNLLVGTTDTALYDATSGGGWLIKPNGANTIARQSATTAQPVLTLNETGVDGVILGLSKDGSTVGSIGSRGGAVTNIILDPRTTSNGGAGIGATGNTSDPAILPTDESTIADNNTDLGNADYRWKDLYLSGGVYLGGTGSANKLEDYEEGTFTPTLRTTASGTDLGTYEWCVGRYIKIGNLVYFEIDINATSISSTGGYSAVIGNLPFTSGSNTRYYPVSLRDCFAFTCGSNNVLNPFVQSNANYVYVQQRDITTNGASNITTFDSSGRINIHGLYSTI